MLNEKSLVYLKANLQKDLKKKQKRVEAINSLINGKGKLEQELSELTAEIKELHKLLNNVNTTHF